MRCHKINTFRRLTFVVVIIIFCGNVFGQTGTDTLPVYRQFPVVPLFKLRLVSDSSVFTKDDLQKKKPLVLMIFSPDCDHCKHAVTELLDQMKLFKKAQIVMSSPLGYDYIKDFYNAFGLSKYDNVRVVYDRDYFLTTFFKVHNYPSIYIYDKKGNFKAAFEGSVDWKKAAEEL